MAFDRALAGRGNRYDCVYADVDAKSARVSLVIGACNAKQGGGGGGGTGRGSCWRVGRPVRGKAPC